ncbi:uncharacterized protein PV06_02684 [Exophiala oligosperma]|uniref:DUF7924 domain-containing protein n=1 Tax=Exophiala oligosperma TaxID=215243 RepID=A0A0D2CB51_9EURO|nr:uncharacterized protein PV06_02684 [Exophiala oligosperma]KIW47077.1 hypothetical protein PV06_02684 [Exophiala oligosperma]
MMKQQHRSMECKSPQGPVLQKIAKTKKERHRPICLRWTLLFSHQQLTSPSTSLFILSPPMSSLQASRPATASEIRLQPATGSGCRRSKRLQNKPQVSYAQTVHRKRTNTTHPVGLDRESPKLAPSIHSLTEENLRRLNEEEMATRKRNGEETRTTTKRTKTQSKQAPSTNGGYRLHRLNVVNIFFDEDVPDYLQAAIDKIVKGKVSSEERRIVIRNAAEIFYSSSREINDDRSLEVEFVGLCRDALQNMSRPGISLRQEADWRCEFKPGLSKGNPIFLDANRAPAIKTPCPDITIGIGGKLFSDSLTSTMLSQSQAQEFLRTFQAEDDSLGLYEEKLLITLMESGRAFFPFATLEAKAYLTGKQVSEAQNQAAVSGASALKFQLHLTEMAKSAVSEFDDTHHQHPLFFSICTEGPYHELSAYLQHEAGQDLQRNAERDHRRLLHRGG